MSGQLLRNAKHQCRPPVDDFGAVWRCECSRRWVCVLDYTTRPDGRAWKRRLLPWPRGNQQPETERWAVGQRGAVVIDTPGMPDGYEPPIASLQPSPPTGGGGGSKGEGSMRHCPGCRCGE